MRAYLRARARGVFMKRFSKLVIAAALGLGSMSYVSAQDSVKDDTVKKDSLEFKLKNYPNPFTITTTFSYILQKGADVSLDIYSLDGKKIATPVHQYQPAGEHLIDYDASSLAKGMYLYRLSVGKDIVTRRMVFVGFKAP
jgi:hypothetical protein